METFLHLAEINITDNQGAQHQDNLEALEILHFHPIKVRLVKCDFS